jgi:hypothetical protein
VWLCVWLCVRVCMCVCMCGCGCGCGCDADTRDGVSSREWGMLRFGLKGGGRGEEGVMQTQEAASRKGCAAQRARQKDKFTSGIL